MVEYTFYTNTYHGNSIPAEDWVAYESMAQAQLDRYKRIYTVTVPEGSSESLAVCAMADSLYYYDMAASGETYTSSTIGSVSSSSGGQVDLSPRAKNADIYRSACLYLNIYRGVR